MKTAEAPRILFPSHTLTTPDGVRLRYFDTGGDLPVLVLANGLGGPVSAWNPYLDRWNGRFRLISWDYRGLYGSLLPTPKTDLTIASHASDVLQILNAAGVKKVNFVGWSMGVQVGLEFYTHNAERVESLTLLNGTFGRPLRGVPVPFAEITLPPLVRGAQRLGGLGSRLLRGISESSLSFQTAKKLRLFAPGLDEQHFRQMASEFKEVDLTIYFDLLGRLSEHNAEAILKSIDVPTLVITGSRDILTPPAYARRIAQEIPRAELFVIPGATHYAAAEYPQLIAARLEKFMCASRV